MAQKVVIPKGLINPQETTIVEIPKELQNVGTVIARRPRTCDSTSSSPKTPKLLKKRSYSRHISSSKNAGKASTFYGVPYDSDVTQPSPHQFRFQGPKNPADRYMSTLSAGDVSYRQGKLRNLSSDGQRGITCIDRAQPFQTGVTASSTFKNSLCDSPERFMYKDFNPLANSSSPLSPARAPASLKHWQSDIGTVSPTSPQSDPESYFHSEVTTETPDEIQTEITEEKSYYDYGSSGPDLSGLPEGAVDSSGEYCPPCGDSSGTYQRYDVSDSGGYQNLELSGISAMSPAFPPQKITQRDLLSSLGNLESTEISQIMTDLNQFQSARRKLVFDASSLASAADISGNLIRSATI